MPRKWGAYLTAVFLTVAAIAWPSNAAGVYGPIAIMPAIHTGGGALSEEGLHFDEVASNQWGGYDYAAPKNTAAWFRGTAEDDQFYPARYMYFKINNCQLTARLQRYIGGMWYDYYTYDLHLLDVKANNSYTGYTQSVQYADDWFYVSVGLVQDPANCPPSTGAHAHLSGHVYGSGQAIWAPKSNDTCWADSTQCNTVMSMFKRQHQTCSSWSGWTQQRSGTIGEYICESWSLMTRDDQTPAFRIP